MYASVQAARLGWRAGFVGRADAELGSLLAPFAHEVAARLQPADRTTRFHNVDEGDARTQWVRAVAPPVDLRRLAPSGDGPVRARVVHLGPVAREVALADAAGAVAGDVVGVTPQGLIRRWGEDGRVAHAPLRSDRWDEVAAIVDVVVVAEEELPHVVALTAAVRRRGGLVVVTRGSQGCLVETSAGAQEVFALPVVDAVDRTGAGDVFAAALFVALAEGRAVTTAVRFAMAAASCSIEGVGPAAVAGREAIERRLAAAGPA